MTAMLILIGSCTFENGSGPGAPQADESPSPSPSPSPAPAPPRATGPRSRFKDADFARHLRKLRPRVPEGFTVLVQKPFVVIGDEPPRVVRQRAERTVKPVVERLKAAYFPEDPERIIDIWLFKDKKSYRKHTREIFGDDPDTPFGYFSHRENALIMNIATGGGTLVHEIVHPFVAANFPACPAWFNEGLGSLYEQCRFRDGKILGLTNWRLRGLQQAIRRGTVPAFETLCSTTTHRFYEEDRGTNYAQARYLCYYLQEHGLLGTFYRRFHAHVKEDPTGYGSLQAVLGRTDMDRFKEEWEAWVSKLTFP